MIPGFPSALRVVVSSAVVGSSFLIIKASYGKCAALAEHKDRSEGRRLVGMALLSLGSAGPLAASSHRGSVCRGMGSKHRVRARRGR